MSIAKTPSSELDPVVVEYARTVERVRREGESALDGWIARLVRPALRQRVEAWRASQASPDSDKLKQLLLEET